MAKKVKTPEEVQVALEKKVAKRTLFFGTFRTALAYFLAIALTFAIVTIAFAPKGGTAVAESTTKVEDKDAFEGQEGLSEGATYVDENGETQTALTTADAVKLLNDATAAAANAGYDWERKCYYTSPIDVGNATNTLNTVIHTVDSNASLDTVVGGFLDITGEDKPLTAKKPAGSNAAPDGMKDKFLLKGMSLTEGDVKQFIQSQDDPTIYMFQLNACSNPQKDGGNALHHATNDFITEGEVRSGVSEALGGSKALSVESANVSFTEITLVAKIVDGKLESLQINYLMTVESLNLKTLVNITGKGAGKVEETYKNFAH